MLMLIWVNVMCLGLTIKNTICFDGWMRMGLMQRLCSPTRVPAMRSRPTIKLQNYATSIHGRFYGLASLTPHQDRDAYRREVERCVKQLKFVGVKIHTIGHSVNPLSEDADFVFQTASELGIPVMVHTGPGVPFALPALCIPPARKYTVIEDCLGPCWVCRVLCGGAGGCFCMFEPVPGNFLVYCGRHRVDDFNDWQQTGDDGVGPH